MFLTEQWRMDSGRMEIKAKASRASAFYIHSFSIQTYNAQIFKRNILTFFSFLTVAKAIHLYNSIHSGLKYRLLLT